MSTNEPIKPEQVIEQLVGTLSELTQLADRILSIQQRQIEWIAELSARHVELFELYSARLAHLETHPSRPTWPGWGMS